MELRDHQEPTFLPGPMGQAPMWAQRCPWVRIRHVCVAK